MGLVPNFKQIPSNGFSGRSVMLKTVQLRVIAVAFGFTLKNFLGQEPFPPDG